ncbi:MAG TPA: class I SAM-dependent methyltransferase [Streptosporangiaceae bacterium]|jgi:hypothetical protein
MSENTDQMAKTDDTGEPAEGEGSSADRVPPSSLDDVPGWFHEVDQHLFHWFLNRQEETKAPGDLVELGVYLGKSTILIGEHLRPDDTFTVCDLFGTPAPDDDNHAESTKSYKDLTREEFEFNYGAFHDELPVIVQAPTGDILGHVAPGAARFVHVDASHLYKHVRADVEAARTMLNDDGIVVFDDYRSPHTPGVSAAVWEAVITLGLKPIALSPQKFYGTWGDADSARRELIAWADERPGFTSDVQEVSGHELVRVVYKAPKKPKPKPAPPADAKPPEPKPAPAKPKAPPPSPARKLARDLLPPIVTRTIRKARKANQAAKPPEASAPPVTPPSSDG